MEKINYQSDFKVQEFSRVNFAVIPFKFTYYTEESGNVYIASYDGNEYINCVKKDDYNIIVSFDNHGLEPGTLKVFREFFINDSEYADGEAHIKEYDRCGIILVKDGIKVCQKLCYTSEIRPNFNNDFSNYYTKEETDIKIDKILGGDINLQNYPTKSEVTTQIQEALSSYEPSGDYVTNEELENKGYITSIPQEYITETELESKGYLTEHQSLIGYAKTSELPKKTSDLINDSGFITADDLGEEVDLTGYAKESWVESQGYLKTIPEEYVTEIELSGKGYAKSSDIPTYTSQLTNNSGFTTLADVDSVGYLKEHQSLSEYYTKGEIDGKGYLTSIPSEYITETELESKGYITEHQSLAGYYTKGEIDGKGYLTSVPSEYITENELTERGYITISDVESKGYITSIPQEYVTETELDSKGYLTEHQSLAGYYTKTEVDSKLGNIDTLLTEILG